MSTDQNESYSIAGKVFLLGEYAVLASLPAVIATVAPRFKMKVGGATPLSVHPESPLGRLNTWVQQMKYPLLSFQFEDPLKGAGGLGASTAQFAMAYLAYARRRGEEKVRWKEVWKLYRELNASDPLPPSGADLVAQWQGGVVFFDGSDEHCMDLWPLFDWSNLLVFSATGLEGRKVPTHQHLELLSRIGFPHHNPALVKSLEECLIRGISAIRENDGVNLGIEMDRYAEILRGAELEVKATYEDRKVLRNMPGVLGVKGAGALQSDAVLVLMESAGSQDSRRKQRAELIEVAEQRGLRLVADGLSGQMGITCQNG